MPTDKGYRLFVDRLTTLKPMSAAERRAISSLLDGAVDLDDVVQRSVRLLAQLTRQVAVVQYPSLSRSTVRHIEVVALAPTRLLIVVILSSGASSSGSSRLERPVADDDLADLRLLVNRSATGRIIAEALTGLRQSVSASRTHHRGRHRRARRGDVRPPLRRAGGRWRDGQPGEVRRQLRLRRTPAARGARGARRPAQVLGEATTGGALMVRIGHEGPTRSFLDQRRGHGHRGRATPPLATVAIVGPPAWTPGDDVGGARRLLRYASRGSSTRGLSPPGACSSTGNDPRRKPL